VNESASTISSRRSAASNSYKQWEVHMLYHQRPGLRVSNFAASEHVTDGHPDKVCDQIADAILDAAIEQDPQSRVAIEVTGGHNKVFVTGELTTSAELDIKNLVLQTYRDIGYKDDIDVVIKIEKQSRDIAEGVDAGGAGDQGVMVGYAVEGCDELMPVPWVLARDLCLRLKKMRVEGTLPYLRPDGKSQIVMENGHVTHVTIACHHAEEVPLDSLYRDIYNHVIVPVVPGISLDNTVINGKGKFTKGGFEADAGTTGRKIVVDSYGPSVEVGGGAYSGKDPTKVDRSAAYMCRLIAKSIVASGMADEALVKVAYSIGIDRPSLLSVQTDRGPEEDEKISEKIRKDFDFRPRAIIERLGLQHPNGWSYKETAAFGHFGRKHFPWEQALEL